MLAVPKRKMSSYVSFDPYPEKSSNKGWIAGVLVGALVLTVVVIVLAVVLNETRKQKQPSGGSASMAVTSTSNIEHSKGSGFPVDGYYPEIGNDERLVQDGYYGTVGDGNDAAFWGVQGGPTTMPPDTMRPNEPLLGQIRREKYPYRSRISNRMNMNSYSFPNTNGYAFF